MMRAAKRAVTKRSKYGAQRVTVDGEVFHSKAEARRWAELKLLEKAGQLHGLRRQVPFVLHAPVIGGRGGTALNVEVARYVADAVYHKGDALVVEDVKGGPSTPLFKLKKRWLLAEYGLTIREVRYR